MISTSKKWFAVNTHNKSERKVCILLNKKKIDTFYPMAKMILQQGQKEKLFYEPLLNNYVFVYASDSEQQEIENTDGIKSMMYWLGAPAVIKNGEIDMLKHISDEHYNLHLEKIRINLDGEVSVNEYSQHEEQGYPELHKKFLKVSLPSLGYAIVAEIKTLEGKIINLSSVASGKSRRAII